MLRIETILHPTDFSTIAKAALGHALHLARTHDAELHLLHVAPTFGEDPLRGAFDASVDEEAFYEQLWDEVEEDMRTLLQDQETTGLHIKRVHSRGLAPGPVVLEYAAENDIDLIVMGTHGRRGLRHLLLGSVAAEVVRQAGCPVLTVRGAKEAAPAPSAVARILVPVDFSASSYKAFIYARELAACYDAGIDLLHVVGTPKNPNFYERDVAALYEGAPDIEARTRAHLERFAEAAKGPAVPLALHVGTGYPAQEILAFAKGRETHLIVMPTHGLSGLEQFLFGSVAEKVVRGALCPVFTVKSFGKSLLSPEREAEAAASPETGAEPRRPPS